MNDPEQADAVHRQQQEAAQREIETLLAQKRMADSTEEIAQLTKLQIILGLFGTAVLLYTLYLNWTTASTAIQALKSERAWVLFEKLERSNLIDTKIGNEMIDSGIGLQVIWKNTGRSPALNAIIWVDYALTEKGSSIPSFDHKNLEPEDFNCVTIGPDQSMATTIMGMNRSNSQRWLNREVRLLIYSRIEYSDIFTPKKRRYTEICIDITSQGNQTVNGRLLASVQMMPVGPQNLAT